MVFRGLPRACWEFFSLDLGQIYNYFVWTNWLSTEFRETSKY